jgi:heme exporter protein C
MLLPLLVMACAFTLLFFWLWLIRIRSAIVARKLRALRLAGADDLGQFDAVRGKPAGSYPS